MKFFSALFQKKRRGPRLAVLLVLCVVAALVADVVFASKQFGKEYAAFAPAEAAYETAAYKPAVGSNPVRQAISYLLGEVLQAPITDEKRNEMAKEGIAHLNDIEGEIDDIKTQGDAVAPLVDQLDKTAGNISNVRSRLKMKELVALARKNAQIISDIRGLSYRTDYYTDEVFERIIDDQGKMTDAHKTYLNDLLPQLESQFDQRTNLYTQMTDNSKKMKQLAHELGYATE